MKQTYKSNLSVNAFLLCNKISVGNKTCTEDNITEK